MKKAITLVELIITMAMLTIVITAIGIIMLDSMTGFSNTTVLASLQSESVTINQIYQNELRNATDVSILEKAPDEGGFDKNKEYIYTVVDKDSKKKVIMLKQAGKDNPEAFYEQKDVEQYIGFSKVDEKTVESVIALTKKDIPYNFKTNTTLENMPDTEELQGSTGDCIMFNFSKHGVFLRQLTFKESDNSQLNADTPSAINEDELTATCDVNTDNLRLKPRVTAINAEYITWGSPDAEPYDIDNPTEIDFSNEQQLYIFGPDGSYKMYRVNVTAKSDDVLPDILAESMDIVPTYKGGDPTDKTNRSMPTDSDELNAIFEIEDDESGEVPYLVTWYAVDDLDDIHDMNKWIKICEIKNNKKLDLSDPLYRDEMVGRYVFASAQSMSASGDAFGIPLYSVTEEMLSDTTENTPYVYVQVGYGKMWGTTLNEIDYKYQGTLTDKQFKNKQDAIDNAYAKSDTFRNGGTIKIDGKNYSVIGYKTDANGNRISSDKFKDARKVLVSGDGYTSWNKQFIPDGNVDSTANETQFITDLKDMSINIKGKRKTDRQTNVVPLSHSILFAVNQYHPYYQDKRASSFTQPVYENSGVRYAVETKPNALGGFAISANIQPVNISEINGDNARFVGARDYYFEYINNRSWSADIDNGQKGIKMVRVNNDNFYNYYQNTGTAQIGARNFSEQRVPSEIPYYFDDINTSKFDFDFSKSNDVTIDTYVYGSTKSWDLSATVSIQMYNTQKKNGFNVPNLESKSAPIYFGRFGEDGIYEYTNNGVKNSLYTVKTNGNVENGVGLSNDLFGQYTPPIDNRPYTTITAWGNDGPLGEFELTVKNIEPLSN